MWGREWVIGTYKHPNLPGWVLEASRVLSGGAVGWPAYLVSQVFVAAAYLFVFLLGRALMAADLAATGTLLLAGVAYYAWPTLEFNHNIAEMPFWAGLAWALWRAVERQSVPAWVLAGALAAGGLYAKLSTVLLLFAAGGWLLFDPKARRSLATPGPWIGLCVFAALVAPLAVWLARHDAAPLTYAAHRVAGPTAAGVHVFAVGALLNLAALPVLLALAGLIGPRFGAAPEGATRAGPDTRGMRYLVWLTVGPLALTAVAALLARWGLRPGWGGPMFNLVGLIAVGLSAHRFRPAALRRIAICAGLLLVVGPAVYATVVWRNTRSAGTPMRVIWPQAEISERLGQVWARHTGRPLRIVTGDEWVAGLVALGSRDRPSILDRGGLSLSPWIAPGRLEADGALVVWYARSRPLSAAVATRIASKSVGEVRFAWPHAKARPDLVIRYAIIPPGAGPR
jgi:4-amino-4-deoxy-L-arabinose transferase-like glycosyltransferase